MTAVAGHPPRRPRIDQFYQSLYYDEKIKEEFEKEWAQYREEEEERRKDAAEEAEFMDGLEEGKEKEELKPIDSFKIAVRNRVVLRMWKEESLEFRQSVKDRLDAHYQSRLKEYEAQTSLKPAETAEEFSAYVFHYLPCCCLTSVYRNLQESSDWLTSMVNTIAVKTGLMASILLCGPMGDRGGRIEVRRYAVSSFLMRFILKTSQRACGRY